MAETATDNRSEPTHFYGSEIRDGKILAQNYNCNVEESYPVAYNLGCGEKHWAGWVNVDTTDGMDLRADLRDLSAIASGSADAIAAIHTLEHFYAWEAEDLLREWMRVLKPGGKMILELPCLDKIFMYIADCIRDKKEMLQFMTILPLYGDPKHKDPLMMHKWSYFTSDLVALLQKIGMREIKIMSPRYHFACRDMRAEAIK